VQRKEKQAIKYQKMKNRKFSVLLVGFSDFGLGRGLYLAEALSRLGLNVEIITNDPIYSANNRSRTNKFTNGKIKITELNLGFLRVLFSSVIGRLCIYLVLTFLYFLYMLKTPQESKILYSRGVHPFADFSCILYKRFNRNVKIISDVTDLWPDALEYIKMNRVLRRMLIAVGHSANYLIYSKIDAIVTLNAVMGKILQERFKRDVHVIYGAIDLDRFKPIDKKDALEVLPQEISSMVVGKFVVIYAGTMGPFQNPLVVVDIAEQIQNERQDVIFVVIGYGPLKQELKNMVQRKSLSNILILDGVPHELMPFIYNVADLTLLPPPLSSVPRMYEYFIVTLPKKFIEYAACGKPILCMTPPCVASKLCLEWKAGYHILPEDVQEAAGIIKVLKENRELKEKLGKNARRLAEELFSIEHAAKILKTVIE